MFSLQPAHLPAKSLPFRRPPPYTYTPRPQALLTDWRSGYYENTKHANVLFGYELQRRLGPLGVQSVVADPGGVRSNLWDKSPMFKKGSFAL